MDKLDESIGRLESSALYSVDNDSVKENVYEIKFLIKQKLKERDIYWQKKIKILTKNL